MRDPALVELFERYRSQGDVDALADLFDRIGPSLLKVARHLDPRRSEAEDLVQTTFLIAIERAGTYDATRPLVPWLMGILINQSRIARRRRKEMLDGGAHEPASTGASGEELESGELAAAVAKALAELPATYREVLVAHLHEGKKPRDIAKELGRPQGTVRAQLHRGLRLMRDLLPASFALGFLALLTPRSLAAVRRNVLGEAKRRAARTSPTAPRFGSGAQSAAVLVLLVAAGFLAWSAGLGARSPSTRDAAVAGAVRDAEPARAELESDPPAVARVVRLSLADAPAAGERDTGTLIVRAIRTGTGKSVEGALVDVLAWGDERWFDHVHEARTLSDGSARFDGVRAGRIGVHVERGGQARADLLPGAVLELEILVEAPGDLAGRVVDEEGAPVAGAEVALHFPDGTRTARAPVATRADGSFELDEVDLGELVGARAPGFAPSMLRRLRGPTQSSEALAAPVLVLRRSTRAIEGRVLDADGSAVAGARVRVGPPRNGHVLWRDDGAAEVEPLAAEARTDREGRFALADLPGLPGLPALPGGELELLVDAEGRPRLRASTREASGTLELRFARGARVHGVLRATSGAPIARALVSADGGAVEARSDANGRYELRLAAGEHVLVARSGRWAPAEELRATLADGEERAWDVELAPAPLIRGRALTIEGGPLPRALVRCVPDETEDASSAPREDPGAWTLPGGSRDELVQSWSDLDGDFVVPCRAGTTHTLEVRRRAHWLGAAAGRVERVESGAEGVVLRVGGRSAWFEGRVVAEPGVAADVALGGARVFAIGDTGTGVCEAAVDARTGAFRLGALVPDAYRVRVCVVGRDPIDVGRFTARAGETVELGAVATPARGVLEVAGPGPYCLRGADGLWRALDPVAEHAWRAPSLAAGAYELWSGTRVVERSVAVVARSTTRFADAR